jgi:hypothetical protein
LFKNDLLCGEVTAGVKVERGAVLNVAVTAFNQNKVENCVAQGNGKSGDPRVATGPRPAAAVLSQGLLRQDREPLPSAAAPVIAATPDATQQKQHHHDHEDELQSTHDLTLLWANNRKTSA